MPILDHLSISSLNTLDRCELQFYFRYVEGMKIPPDGAMTKGKSYHKAHEKNFIQKIVSKTDLPKEEVTQEFVDQFDLAMKETELKENEDAGELKDSGVKLVSLFHEQKAPTIQPQIVETKMEVEVANYPFQSILDLATTNDSILDLKTTGSSPSGNPAEKSSQLTGYDLTFRKVFGRKPTSLDLNFAISTKEPKLKDFTSPPRSDLQLELFEEEIGIKLEVIKSGNFRPAPLMVGNRENYICNKAYCGFFKMCRYGEGRHG